MKSDRMVLDENRLIMEVSAILLMGLLLYVLARFLRIVGAPLEPDERKQSL